MSSYRRLVREQEVRRLRARKPRARYIVGIEETDMRDIEINFAEEVRAKVLTKAVKAAADIVKRRYQENLQPHRSKVTGTRKKWSKAIREQRAWRGNRDLSTMVGTKIKNYKRPKGVVLGMVGAKRPGAGHAGLLEWGATIHLWNNQEGGATAELPPRFPLRRAGEDTKGEQRAAIEGITKAMGETF